MQETDKLSDDDLYKFLADLKRPSSTVKKLKCIPGKSVTQFFSKFVWNIFVTTLSCIAYPGQLKLDVSPCPEDLKYCLTPELYKIDPYPDDKGRPIKEVVEFAPREVYEPFTTYR